MLFLYLQDGLTDSRATQFLFYLRLRYLCAVPKLPVVEQILYTFRVKPIFKCDYLIVRDVLRSATQPSTEQTK